MRQWLHGVLRPAVLGVCLLGTACGSDGANDAPAASADAGKDAGDMRGGDEDAGGTKDAGAGDAAAAPFQCGDVVCPMAMFAGLAPCCTDEGAGKAGDPLEVTGRAANLCGVDLSPFVPNVDYVCMQLNQPGELDPSCPEVDSPGGKLPGCCSDEGFCGGMETGVPLGCTYGAEGKALPCGGEASADAGTDAG